MNIGANTRHVALGSKTEVSGLLDLLPLHPYKRTYKEGREVLKVPNPDITPGHRARKAALARCSEKDRSVKKEQSSLRRIKANRIQVG
jgi:hypothetical protein